MFTLTLQTVDTICQCFVFLNNRDTFIIFSGGMPTDKPYSNHCLTIMQSKNITVLEMEHAIVDFVTLCQSPWPHGLQICDI